MVQFHAGLRVILLNHQVAVGVVSRIEVGDNTARNSKNSHDCGMQSQRKCIAVWKIRDIKGVRKVIQLRQVESSQITCTHDSCKHPALPISDGAVVGLGPHSQNVPAPGPRGRMDPLFEVI